MEPIEHFVPGKAVEDEGVLRRLRWPIPADVARAYVEAYTEPGELVLLPYCQGAEAVRACLTSGRRALAVHFDPLLVLLVEAALTPRPRPELDAAVARLGDSPKQGQPLRRYLAGLYATTCPACLRPAVADYFVWDRDKGAPVAKYLRCPACSWDGRTGLGAEDHERLADVPARGMHYHYVLDRLIPKSEVGALQARLEQLLELYTPRNLYALAELTLKIEGLFPAGPLRRALQALLLDCLDRCSSLETLPGSPSRRRRRGLARPGRFLERNVWRAFEQAIARLQALASKPLSGLADTLETFQSSTAWPGFAGQGQVRELVRALSPRSVRLILASPPPLDSAAWSLSYLWAAWLLGAEAAAPLRPLLRQRTPDPAWYARVMASSLGALADLLPDDGRLVLVLIEQRPAVVQALALAASQARLGIAALVQRDDDYRLDLSPAFQRTPAAPDKPPAEQLRAAAAADSAAAIRARGQPATRQAVHAAILRGWARRGLLDRALEVGEEGSPLDLLAEQLEAALEDPALVRLPGPGGKELWWLADPDGMAAPLDDRVEAEAFQVLQGALALTEADFAARLHARFPGVLTPDAALVSHCLRAYGREPTPGYWQLRSEDLPDARQAERAAMIERLLALGRRLGHRAGQLPPFDAAWFEGERPRATFVVRWQAALSEALALSSQTAGATPYLVIPGGRAALASYKLAHNPLWQRAVDEAGWRFLKYRHVRQLASQSEVDEYALRTIVGLDPIVEQEQAQLPLF